MYFDNVFQRREELIRKSIEIDDTLYSRLEEYAKTYDATISDLVNACVAHLLSSGQLPIYESQKPLYVMHTLRLRAGNLAGLESLKEKYGISLFRLVNMAIKFTVDA